MMQPGTNQHGFTLVEVIVTIIVSSILAVLLVQIMKGHVERSLWPMQKMNERLALQDTMNKITADYRRLLITDTQPLVTLQSHVDAGGSPGGYWFGTSHAAAMQIVDNYCLDLDASGESNTHSPCIHPMDTILKVTLKIEEQLMTALFTR